LAPAQADPPPTQTAAAPPSEPPQAQPERAAAPRPSPLGREEIREVQKRLRGFGFNPGPIDGVPGRQTEIATQSYLEARGQPQLPPTDHDLLAQLRQDPAPQVVQAPPATQVAQRPSQYAGQQPQRSSFDPFQPVKYAGTEITRFFQAILR
jgi:peptidoglycan hydrolase-like protein with peptidoglycan-binding domain